jgi:thiosulfate dehydrogenase [quinone] large subunit
MTLPPTPTRPLNRAAALAAPVAAGAARVGLGVLWLNEGLIKYRAGFGAADIQLVVDSASSNSRVPDFCKAFTGSVLGGSPELFGFVMPLLEVGLGVVLIAGVLTLPAALMSVLTLMTYWLADQLTASYPIMVALAVVVATWPLVASRISVTTLVERVVRRRRPNSRRLSEAVRRWL